MSNQVMSSDEKLAALATQYGIEDEAARSIYRLASEVAKEQRAPVSFEEKHQRALEMELDRDMVHRAYSKGMTLSAYLEHQDPSRDYPGPQDAFERQLMVSNIAVRSTPMTGVYADEVARFWASDKSGSEWLFPEFISRTWRRASLGGMTEKMVPNEGRQFYMSSSPVSDVLHPDFVSSAVRMRKDIQAAIPLSRLVGIVTPIDSGSYVAFYLTDSEPDRQMARVSELAAVPVVTLTGGDHAIRPKKYGRALMASYETIRRTRIDRLALHISLIAIQAETDKVAHVLDVIENGDGNAGTAATVHDKTTLQGGVVGDPLSLTGYLAWRMKYYSPYMPDVALGREAHILDLMLMNMGSANVPFFSVAGNFGIGGVVPISDALGPLEVGWIEAASANYLYAMDTRFAVEMITEVGASLVETDKIVTQQFNVIVLTEVVGFCIMDQRASRILDLNA